jgi:DNA-binding transcriptional ArsR family regulator
MDKTQRANDLRFEILSLLGERGVELIREFESALAEEQQDRSLNHPYVFTDRRAKAIAEATKRVDILAQAVHHVGSGQVPTGTIGGTEERERNVDSHLALLKEALAAKDTAYALPEHEYDCILCGATFVSPAREVLIVTGYVDHDGEGNVIAARMFHKPAHLVFCPECKVKFGIESYLKRWD